MIADEASLSALMRRAQAGDKAAYRTVLQNADGWLRRYFRRRIAPDRLDDLVQETLLSLHKKRASFDGAQPFTPWLAAIARYRWVDALRADYRRAAMQSEGEAEAGDSADAEAFESRFSLDAMFAALPPAQVEAIRLTRIDGLSVQEAARACGQSESLVKVNVHRGLKRLAQLVEEA